MNEDPADEPYMDNEELIMAASCHVDANRSARDAIINGNDSLNNYNRIM